MKDIFTYTDNFAPFTARATQVVIPKSITSKADLLSLFSERLSFPKGFGANWDALFDCLRDLSWIRGIRVVVVHEGIPAMLSADDLRAYLGLLGDAVVSWQKKPGAHELVVIFPAKETKQV